MVLGGLRNPSPSRMGPPQRTSVNVGRFSGGVLADGVEKDALVRFEYRRAVSVRFLQPVRKRADLGMARVGTSVDREVLREPTRDVLVIQQLLDCRVGNRRYEVRLTRDDHDVARQLTQELVHELFHGRERNKQRVVFLELRDVAKLPIGQLRLAFSIQRQSPSFL